LGNLSDPNVVIEDIIENAIDFDNKKWVRVEKYMNKKRILI
jgi:hypothetical protein